MALAHAERLTEYANRPGGAHLADRQNVPVAIGSASVGPQLNPLAPRKEVILVEWIKPDFEEFESACEVTMYAYHW